MANVDRSGNDSSSDCSGDDDEQSKRDETYSFVFRMNDDTGSGPELVREVLLERGWTEYNSNSATAFDPNEDWNFWWRTSHFKASDYSRIRSWQRLNHFPCAFEISRKDYLARNMKRMRLKFPESYNFVPESYHLPTEYVTFLTECNRSTSKPNGDRDRITSATERETSASTGVLSTNWKPPNRYWICKPSDMSRGRGIHIFTDVRELQHTKNCVVQRYVHNPLLLYGYKFDCRIYVLIVSFKPLIMYVYDEGIVRFSTEKYDLNDLTNVYAHLTNSSINKLGCSYNKEKIGIGAGCKWSLTRLRHFLQNNNYNTERLWSQIIEIIILTILCQAVHASMTASNCFELFGFDILIDSDMKPWLLEVNFCPQLSDDCPLDRQVKKPLINDLIDLLSFQESDMRRLKLKKGESVLSRQRRSTTSSAMRKTSAVHRSSSRNRINDKPQSPLRRTATALSLDRSHGRRAGSTGCEMMEDSDYYEFKASNNRPKTSLGTENRALRSQMQGEKAEHAERFDPKSADREYLLVTLKPLLPALASDKISLNRAAFLRIYGPRLLSQSRVSSESQTSSLRSAPTRMSSLCSGTPFVPPRTDDWTSENGSDNGSIRLNNAVRVRSKKLRTQTATTLDCSDAKPTIAEPATIMDCYELCQQAAQLSKSRLNSLYSAKNEQQSQQIEAPTRVGGFVLLYPFNAATKQMDGQEDRSIVQQLKHCIKNEIRFRKSKSTSAKPHISDQRPPWTHENLWDLA